jgi:hypothetical protein
MTQRSIQAWRQLEAYCDAVQSQDMADRIGQREEARLRTVEASRQFRLPPPDDEAK